MLQLLHLPGRCPYLGLNRAIFSCSTLECIATLTLRMGPEFGIYRHCMLKWQKKKSVLANIQSKSDEEAPGIAGAGLYDSIEVFHLLPHPPWLDTRPS
jgi:hypothetical protein